MTARVPGLAVSSHNASLISTFLSLLYFNVCTISFYVTEAKGRVSK